MPDMFFRVAAAVPAVNVADPMANADSIIDILNSLDKNQVTLAVFPELCVTAYTCGDLFHSSTLLQASDKAIEKIAAATANLSVTAIVGAPVLHNNCLYNCAIAIASGRVLMMVPKTYLPNYNEFYEKRLWTSGADIDTTVNGIPLTTRQLLTVGNAKIGMEICEDLWTPIPPSCKAAMAGADIIANLSASNDIIGKYTYLRSLIAQQSARCLCGYVYSSAGYGESSTDLVFDGKAIIAENGSILASNERWQSDIQTVITDIDLAAIRRDRMHIGSFTDTARNEISFPYHIVNSPATTAQPISLMRHINPHPFVPADDTEIDARCNEIINIQVAGLAKRLDATHCKTLVIGISGGLDSTLALLVAVKTFRRLNLPLTGIIGVTMPGFGTTGRTHTNALRLMQGLGVTTREISIVPAVNQHFRDIAHDPSNHDVTYENSQARERTQLLMDIANQQNGMVLGTGDLSELALGWATYNGDHMSMYGVNASVPKTLVKYLVRWFALRSTNPTVTESLLDIIDTPISPELTPADDQGNIAQKTEDLVGPYELHDFFLYYTLRYGYTPRRIYHLARAAFPTPGAATSAITPYSDDTIRHWLRTFFRRFFNQQFKRSCLPDGPKVGSVCLSPRGDWRMPSDASSALWLRDLDTL